MSLGAVIALLPFLWMVSTSLKDVQDVVTLPPQWIPNPAVTHTYPDVWNELPFANFFVNSMYITLASVAGQLLVCSLSAYAFARLEFRGRDKLFYLYLATMMIPGQVTLIPAFMLMRWLNWIDTSWALIVPGLGSAFGIFLLRQFFLTIPHELGEAARIDGAGEWRIFQGIVLPLAKPALASVALFTFLYTYTDFLGPLIYLNDAATYTLSLGLAAFKNAFSAEWQLMMAASVMMTLPVIGLFFLTQRTFIQGITLGGIKG